MIPKLPGAAGRSRDRTVRGRDSVPSGQPLEVTATSRRARLMRAAHRTRPLVRLLASAGSFALLLAFPGTAQTQDPAQSACSHARLVAGWLSGLGPQPDYAAGTLIRLADLITDPRFEVRTADENFRVQVAEALYQANMRSGTVFELWEATRAAADSAVSEALAAVRDATDPTVDSLHAVLPALRDSISPYGPTYDAAVRRAREARQAQSDAEDVATTIARTAASRVADAARRADTYAREHSVLAAVFAASAAGMVVVDRVNEVAQGRTPNTGVVNNGFVYGAATAAALAAAVTRYDPEWLADRLADPRWAEGFAEGVEAIANSKIAELRDCERANP